MATVESGRKVILINDAVLALPRETLALDPGARVFVAGRSVVQMTLAELAVPDAQMILTDFRQSASLGALNSTLQAAGGLDRLILAADGDESETVFSIMCAVLTFRSALRRRRGRIDLILQDGRAVGSLVEFLQRIGGTLDLDGISTELRVSAARAIRAVA
ncbi:MAG: hypothetical protein U1E69_12125 [Tabrizicola sp.]|uniref:hypothetical protein n=1 Tax=Tabrizicola sp. TaxID=2005166 RepID=UPI002ABC2F32|nr:hypothetical protein [Tabrizicola sp.]MDZ4087532.1 hypothetical protein [Tabrizicola sp.]